MGEIDPQKCRILPCDPEQERLSREWVVPNADRIIAAATKIRSEIDEEKEELGIDAGPLPYPLGRCGFITTAAAPRLLKEPVFRDSQSKGLHIHRVYFIQPGAPDEFMNGIQVGNHLLLVANDTTRSGDEPVDFSPLAAGGWENLESWERAFEVTRQFTNATLLPNRIFPLLFPLHPYFLVSKKGTIHLSFQLDLLFRLDLEEGWPRARTVAQSPEFNHPASETPLLRLANKIRQSKDPEPPTVATFFSSNDLLQSLEDWTLIREQPPERRENTLATLYRLAKSTAEFLKDPSFRLEMKR